MADNHGAWMREHPDATPVWAEEVPPEAPLALLHAYLMSFAPLDAPSLWRRDPASKTGAALALAPQRTHSGDAALAFAIEGAYDGPFRWYEAHLILDSLNVYGATLYGVPVMLMGHGPHVAWSFVPNQTDFADVYLVEPGFGVSAPANQIGGPVGMAGADWASYVLANTRMLRVRTGGGLEPRPVECLMDSHGPVIGEIDGKFAVWRIGGYWQLGAMRQLIGMAMAENLREMDASLSWRQIPSFHILGADTQGNIGYLYNSTTGDKGISVRESFFGPDGPVGINQATVWSGPIDSADARMQWGPVLAMSALPSVTNPAEGYLQATENPPWRANHSGGGIAPNAFPGWFAKDMDSRRAARMRDMIRHGKRTFDQVQATLFDTHVPEAGPLVARVLEIVEAQPQDVAAVHPDMITALKLLKEWTRAAEPNSTGMTLFNTWWTEMNNRASALNVAMHRAVEEAVAKTEAGDRFLIETLARAVESMLNQFNSLEVPWGDVHVIRRGARESALPGGAQGGALWTSRPGRFDGRAWAASGGYTYAMNIAMNERARSASVVPFGASERPRSPHFDDQMDLFLARRMKDTLFTLDDVQRNALGGPWSQCIPASGRVAGIRRTV